MPWPIDDESSLSGEEACSRVGSSALKKGPWTPAEDAILNEYVKKHGEGNWNAVQKLYGLSRGGKSCRLRWANHLRPDLKKGTFSPEEEDTIIRLQVKLGNKWAQIAAELPGRTDNDVKNFWNTRIKRLQRAGVQIYPDDVLNESKSNESQRSQVSHTFPNKLRSSHYLMEAGSLGVPVFKIEHSLCSELYSSNSKILGFSTNNLLPQGLVPSCDIYCQPATMRPRKRLRESDSSQGLNDTASSSLFNQWNCSVPFQYHPPYELPPLPGSYCGDNSSFHILPGSHALINGNHSTSNPNFGSAKLELPSLQNSDSDYSFWDAPPSPLPSLKSTDTSNQSSQDRPSQLQGIPDNDGLLESLVWPSSKVKTFSFENDPEEKATIGNCDGFLVDISEAEWEEFTDTIPPICSSNAADCNDLTLVGFSTEELQPTDAALVTPQANTPDIEPKTPQTGLRTSNLTCNGDSYQPDSSGPDTWLNANLFSPDTQHGKDFLVLQEAISSLKGDNNQLYQPQQI